MWLLGNAQKIFVSNSVRMFSTIQSIDVSFLSEIILRIQNRNNAKL